MAYSIQDETRLISSNHSEFTRISLKQTLVKALPRRLRKHYRVERFLTTLDTFAEASVTWNVTRRIQNHDDNWATLCAWTLPSLGNEKSYSVDLFGPSASLVLERLNVERRSQKRQLKRNRKLKLSEKRRRKQLRNQKKLEERKRKFSMLQQSKPQKRQKVRAVMSHKLGDITPQFKKTRVFFEEAVDMILFACPTQRDPRRTSRQMVMHQLFRSFEHTGYRFARIRYDDFSIALTIEGDRWRGIGLTPVRVWCDKNNRHSGYRRLRKWLHQNSEGLSRSESSIRRHLLFGEDLEAA